MATSTRRQYLVDTDVLIYWATGHPTYERYRPILTGQIWSASVVTFGEVRLVALRDAIEGLEKVETRRLLGDIAMLSVDDAVAKVWAEITAALAKRAERKTNDLWIAATAIAHGLPLVTNNPQDFGGIAGLEVVTR